MAKGRGMVSWSMVGSVIRAICLSMTGTEPPLAAFIPADYLPEEQQQKKLTKREQAEREEIKRQRDELDKQIMAKAMAEGKFRGRVGGTK